MAPKHPSSNHPIGIEISERDQANNLVATYITSGKDRIDVTIPKNTNSYAKSILNAFLPAGYPHSVTHDYLEYQIYDSLQAFSSSIAGLLSSRAVLEGIGVGDSQSTPTSALLLSILQESMGRIATILFAHRLGTSLEPECKMYRLAADIFNDSAMVLDCLSPAFPKTFRVGILGMSSVLRALCGVAAGSSKASLSAHFARVGNLGELNAKDSSQETIISLLGMLAGTFVVSFISSSSATWSAMIFLLFIHLGTNYLAVRAVSMRTLNRQRANILFSDLLIQARNSSHEEIREKGIPILSPEEVSVRERVFERDGVLRWNGADVLGFAKLGVPLKNLLDRFSVSDSTTGSYTSPLASTLLNVFQEEEYIMWYDNSSTTFFIVLKSNADTAAQLKAWMHALYFAKFGKEEERGTQEAVLQALYRTLGVLNVLIAGVGSLEKLLEEKGWDVKTGALETRSGVRVVFREEEGW